MNIEEQNDELNQTNDELIVEKQNETIATSSLNEDKEQEIFLKKQEEKKLQENTRIISYLMLFVIPIIGPIVFLCKIKPQDKLVKTFSYLSIIPGLNWLFIFFLMGFYKKDIY